MKIQLEKLKQKKAETVQGISHLKQNIIDLELQENEIIREVSVLVYCTL